MRPFFITLFLALTLNSQAVYAKPLADSVEEASRLIDAGDYDKALGVLNRVIGQSNEFPMAYFHRGMILFEKDHADKALADFDKALEINPRFALGYLGRAKVLIRDAAQEDQVLQELDKAIALDPGLGIAYYNRGLLYERRSEFEKAFQDLEEARQLGIDVEKDLLEKTWTLSNLDEVIKRTTAVIEENPDQGDAYYDRGVSYYYKRDYGRALDDLKRAQVLGVDVEPELFQEVEQKAKTNPAV